MDYCLLCGFIFALNILPDFRSDGASRIKKDAIRFRPTRGDPGTRVSAHVPIRRHPGMQWGQQTVEPLGHWGPGQIT